MFACLLLFLSLVFTAAPAFAGLVSATPELDPGSLATVTAGVTVGYLIYRLYRLKTRP